MIQSPSPFLGTRLEIVHVQKAPATSIPVPGSLLWSKVPSIGCNAVAPQHHCGCREKCLWCALICPPELLAGLKVNAVDIALVVGNHNLPVENARNHVVRHDELLLPWDVVLPDHLPVCCVDPVDMCGAILPEVFVTADYERPFHSSCRPRVPRVGCAVLHAPTYLQCLDVEGHRTTAAVHHIAGSAEDHGCGGQGPHKDAPTYLPIWTDDEQVTEVRRNVRVPLGIEAR
mmetsp:Transcript_92341/g.214582  ORF Transcript_92341/g.214582 Transcript_92341/m.214582 type:complete len:230 (-) Transcript_92341:890-1579(-)